MNEIEVKLNRVAQGYLSKESAIGWFSSENEISQKEILQSLNLCIHQSHPTEAEIEKGISESGLKETYTPCVIMRSNNFMNARRKILGLPANEWVKSFTLWLYIFCIADARRRATDCKNGCDHWWHNLSKL